MGLTHRACWRVLRSDNSPRFRGLFYCRKSDRTPSRSTTLTNRKTTALVTSALPYINPKHLGNLAGSLLPSDVHARYRRQRGDEVLFICATDEHGTPAELGAKEAGLEVAEYCTRQHQSQAEIYRRLRLSFDHFGRSSSPQNHALTQHFFRCLEDHGFIEERILQQLYCLDDQRFLPDRYIVGTCPHCRSGAARGDQCEACTRQLDPTDLLGPRSAISGSVRLQLRPTRHLFLRQSALVGELEAWLATRSDWPHLVTSIARKWLDQGIEDRCITRDLEWGVPVPKPGYDGKVFYVWFDAPIAYIAATQEWAGLKAGRNWRRWWWEADDVEYLQFVGKDNVPFHAVSFPCTLLGSREPWKTVDVIKGVNWLTYEGGKFSTSGKRGVFLEQALELLPADYWRWWLAANCPEKSDTDFAFDRFAASVNSDLADGFGNLVNRVLKFTVARYGAVVPAARALTPAEAALASDLDRALAVLKAAQDRRSFRKAAEAVRGIWHRSNAYLQEEAPWAMLTADPERAAAILATGISLVALSAVVAWPFIPDASEKVLKALRCDLSVPPAWPTSGEQALRLIPEGRTIELLPPMFAKLGPDWVQDCVGRFGRRQ
jgi:methionyl-tRNA synthetase